MSKTRINWKGISAITMIAAGLSSVSVVVHEYFDYQALDNALANLSINEDGKNFMLGPEGGVTTQIGTLYQTFDFAGRNIAMTGSLLGHQLNTFQTFEAYGRNKDIEQARNNGCRIAANALNFAAAYDPGLLQSGIEFDRLTQIRATATAFRKSHCPAP
jgi:hypothetical protein